MLLKWFRSSRNHHSGRPSYKEESGTDEDDTAEPEEEENSDSDEYKEEEKPKVKVKDKDKDKERETPRKRKSGDTAAVVPTEDAVVVPKKKLKRLERKIVSNDEEKFSIEELMETNTYQRFTRLVENIFDATEDADLNGTADLDNDTDIPQEAMIPKQQLHDLCAEAAKLKVN